MRIVWWVDGCSHGRRRLAALPARNIRGAAKSSAQRVSRLEPASRTRRSARWDTVWWLAMLRVGPESDLCASLPDTGQHSTSPPWHLAVHPVACPTEINVRVGVYAHVHIGAAESPGWQLAGVRCSRHTSDTTGQRGLPWALGAVLVQVRYSGWKLCTSSRSSGSAGWAKASPRFFAVEFVAARRMAAVLPAPLLYSNIRCLARGRCDDWQAMAFACVNPSALRNARQPRGQNLTSFRD